MKFDLSAITSFITIHLFTWYGVTIVAALIYATIGKVKREIFIKKHGCKEAYVFPDGGPFGLILGYLLQKYKSNGEILDFALSLYDKYGRRSTLAAYLFGVRIVVTGEPENMKAILATQFNDFSLGFRHAHFKPLLGDGIFTLDNEGWKESRQLFRPQFAREQISHVKMLEPHVQVLAEHIRKNKGQTFDLQELFFRLTVDASTEFLFGESVHSLYDESIGRECDPDVANFADAFNEAQVALGVRTYLQPAFFLYNPPSFWKNSKIVHNFAKTFVNKALSLTPEQLEERTQKHGYTFLYELVKHTRNPKVLQDQLLNIMVAGRDTTAGLLSFTFFELAKHQDVWNKLKEEIYQHFGSGEDSDVENITFETLKQCN